MSAGPASPRRMPGLIAAKKSLFAGHIFMAGFVVCSEFTIYLIDKKQFFNKSENQHKKA